MGSDIRHVRGEAQKELVKKFEVFTSKGRSRWQVWSDWITISAIAVSNATDKSHFDEREQQYMTIVKKYTKQEVDAFADKYQILIAASGKHGSALLPYVLVDDKSGKSAAARAKVMAKACYPEYEKFDVAKMEVISDE